jgi:hypothetical protein
MSEAAVRDHLARGEAYAAACDMRAATSFFQAALREAQAAGTLPQPLLEPLRRAQAYVRQAALDYQAHLERAVAGAGAGPRFDEAIEILFGRREIYHQQPSAFYFPGLPQRQFYEREEFEWSAALEDETGAIREELAALLASDASFAPYVQAEKDRPARDFHGMADDPGWGAFYLWQDGALVEENAARCPRTVAALSKVPMSRIGSRTPSVLFSLLRPRAHIPPHHGMLNSRLICHLPLVVPPGCWLRVGNEAREWEPGKLLVFDDSIEHEAKNSSSEVRVILLFDIWRPELTGAERAGVSAIFKAIDGYGRGPAAA